MTGTYTDVQILDKLMTRKIFMILLSIICLVIILGAAATAVSHFSKFELFSANPDDHETDIHNIKRTGNPNDFLMAPNGILSQNPDEISPVFSLSTDQLRSQCLELFGQQPRTSIYSTNHPNQIVLIQRSAIFRFPDLIIINIFPVGSNQATFAIYSRSLFGYSDLGVNQKRVLNWKKLLEQNLAQSSLSWGMPPLLPSIVKNGEVSL
jgi:uncharacterized protein (DUF1499 family)